MSVKIKKPEVKAKRKANEFEKFKAFEMTSEIYSTHIMANSNPAMLNRYREALRQGRSPSMEDVIECFDLLGF